jgi:hypothetical protein
MEQDPIVETNGVLIRSSSEEIIPFRKPESGQSA